MRLFRRKRDLEPELEPEEPEGVRLLIAGREYPCDVIRNAALDTPDYLVWLAMLRGDIPPTELKDIGVLCRYLPEGSLVMASFPADVAEHGATSAEPLSEL